MEHLLNRDPVLPRVAEAQEVLWRNPKLQPAAQALECAELGMDDIRDAQARLDRFASFIRVCFPRPSPAAALSNRP